MTQPRRSAIRILTACAMLGMFAAPAFAQNQPQGQTQDQSSNEPVKCHALKGGKDKKVDITPRNTYLADPKDIEECINRGWSPPCTPGLPSTCWQRNGGESAPIKTQGSGGFSVGTVSAPESPPGQKGAMASVSAKVIRTNCTFPPRVKINSSGLQFPKGSCWDFFNDLLKDKDGATNTSPPPPANDPNTVCPADSDKTGAYGTKSSVPNGASSTLPCGGMVPLSTVDMVLNANPAGIATTENGGYYIWFYKKPPNGNAYTATAKKVPLPGYLCSPIQVGDGSAPQKSIDLTPPIAQIITYDANASQIHVRLQSRATMPPNFIPPYNSEAPERYLVIPIINGAPQVPVDCADEATYLSVPTSKQDITVSSASEGCEKLAVPPTPKNNPTLECPGGTPPDAANKCYDSTGAVVAPVVKNNWTQTCPPDSKTGQEIKPVNGVCQQAIAGITSGDCGSTKATISQNGVTSSVSCPTTTREQACSASNSGGDVACDIVEMPLENSAAACPGQIQFGVLTRPNLYYPPGSNATLRPVEERSFLMADTTAGNKFFVHGDTDFLMQRTAPALAFSDGGQIRLKNNDILIMEPPATINMAGNTITLTGGGQLASSGGIQKQSFAPGATFSIPDSVISLPLNVKVNGSVIFPAGYSIPTMPKVGDEVPYVRQPKLPPK